MNILALDTSSRAASCALLRGGTLAGEFFANTGLTHSQTAMPMVEALLRQTGASLRDIDIYAVSTGPGSFTGLRIGIASVKGMACAAGKPCAGVSTLEVLALGTAFFNGYIAPVMDARRDQVYTALFRQDGGEFPERVSQDTAISIRELEDILAPLAPAPVLLVGDGAVLCRDALGHLSHIRLAPERIRHQRAACVAVVAAAMAERGELVSADALAPGYLRLPQAERERLNGG